jgi:hypothetical protein
MANKARGEVPLELGGETYVLVPSFGAVCEIEDKIGTNLFHLGRRLALSEISARDLLDFAHACVSQAGGKLDKARLGELIVEAGTHSVIAALTEFCANYAFGGREEKKDPATGQPKKSRKARARSPASSGSA